MNAAMTLEQCGMIRKNDDSLAFLTARAKRSATELSGSATRVFSTIHDTVNQLLINIIEKRTADEFKAALDKSFPIYVSLLSAVSNFTMAVVPQQTIERLTRESLCETEASFRHDALNAFGVAVRDQAIFTVWTIRKITDLLAQIHAHKLSNPDNKTEDKTCSDNFTYHAYRANFGLDCLLVALESKSPVYPEVLDEVTDCLRSAVNAYAWVRKGVDLRLPATDDALSQITWDDEDEELLAAAMKDISNPEDGETVS